MKLLVVSFFVASNQFGIAEASNYVPIGIPLSNYELRTAVYHPVKLDVRPKLPGTRSIDLELLEDVMERKMPFTIGSNRRKAHDKLIRVSLRDPVKIGQMTGNFAEAVFLEKNPHYGYVRSPNATQHDITSRIKGRRAPYNVQVKTHASGNPATYANDMWSDIRSNHFAVPDDHVGPLKAYLDKQIYDLEKSGRIDEARQFRAQRLRVTPIGATYGELNSRLRSAAQSALRERTSVYVSLGAASALAFGPEVLEIIQDGYISTSSSMRIVHTGGVLASGAMADVGLGKFKSGALKGGLRGNVLTGSVIVLADSIFTIYEVGPNQAFKSPTFYANLAGNVSAASVGIMVGISATGVITKISKSPYVGAVGGLVFGSGAGILAYLVGHSATMVILERRRPEMFLAAENRDFELVEKNIQGAISNLRNSPFEYHKDPLKMQ